MKRHVTRISTLIFALLFTAFFAVLPGEGAEPFDTDSEEILKVKMTLGASSFDFQADEKEINRVIGEDGNLENIFSLFSDPDTYSGTINYTLDSSLGTFSFSPDEDESMVGHVSSDGGTVLFADALHYDTETDKDSWAYMGVAIKQKSDFSSLFSETTTFRVHRLENGFMEGTVPNDTDTVFLQKQTVVFNSDGTFTITAAGDTISRQILEAEPGNAFLTSRNTGTGGVSGTYTIESNGVIKITYDQQGPFNFGQLSADGQTLVTTTSPPGVSQFGLRVGVNMGSTYSTEFTPGTTFVVHGFGSGFKGNSIDDQEGAWGSTDFTTVIKWTLTFDGEGGFSVDPQTSTDKTNWRNIYEYREGDIYLSPPEWWGKNIFTAGQESDFPPTGGAYTIATDGTVTMAFTDGPMITGYLSADGEKIVSHYTGWDEPGQEGLHMLIVGVLKNTSGGTTMPAEGDVFNYYEVSSGFNTWGGEEGPENLAVDFGAGKGLYKYDGIAWSRINPNDAENVIAWGDKLVAEFAGISGVFVYEGGSWSRKNPNNAENMIAWGANLVVDFGAGKGLYKYDGIAWSRINPNDAENVITWGDKLVAGFAGISGVFVYEGGSWSRKNPNNAESIVPF